MTEGEKNEATRGILIFLAAWAVVPLMDVCAKKLGQDGVPLLQIVWARFFFNSILVVPLMAIRDPGAFRRPRYPVQQIMRVTLLIAATFFYFGAIRTMGLAEALSIYFIYPFVITAFAPLFLGERVGPRRGAAVAVGFAGSLIIIRPGFTEPPEGVAFVLAGAVCFGFYNLLTRRLAGSMGAGEILMFQSLGGTVALSAIVPFFWMAPDAETIALFALIGLFSAAGHFLLIKAYQMAPASLLAPYCYFEIVSATIFGLIFFGNFPGLFTWVGVSIIVACGIYISFRERHAHAGSG